MGTMGGDKLSDDNDKNHNSESDRDSDSDSNSDDEFLRQYAGRSVFAKRPKLETPNLTQSSVETTCTDSPTLLSPHAIEEKAQKVVEGMQYPIVQRIDNLADIGWRKTQVKRQTVLYPCIRLRTDEARLMFAKLSESKIPIRYLGWRWKHATTWEQVVPSTFYPLGDHDENNLQQFLDHECGTLPSVQRRVEELVIRGCWRKVQQNQQTRHDKEQQEQDMISQLNATPKSECKTKTNPSADNIIGDRDDDDDDSDGNDEKDLLSPTARRKRIILRPGDVVEYYLPGRVFGNPDVLCQSKIVGVNPKGAFPLNLESGDFLDPDQKVKRLAKIHKGVLVEDTEGVFRAVREFALRTAGTKVLVGFQNKVHQINQSRQDHAKSMDEFWQTKADVDGDVPKTNEVVATTIKAPTTPTTATQVTSQIARKSNQPAWHKLLLDQLELVEENIKTKRRYIPHINPDELRLIMKTWSLLQDRVGQDMQPEQAIQILVDELEISELRIEAILSGDPDYKLSQGNKLEVLKGLEEWIKHEPKNTTDFRSTK